MILWHILGLIFKTISVSLDLGDPPQGDRAPLGPTVSPMTCPPLAKGYWKEEMQPRICLLEGSWLCIAHSTIHSYRWMLIMDWTEHHRLSLGGSTRYALVISLFHCSHLTLLLLLCLMFLVHSLCVLLCHSSCSDVHLSYINKDYLLTYFILTCSQHDLASSHEACWIICVKFNSQHAPRLISRTTRVCEGALYNLRLFLRPLDVTQQLRSFAVSGPCIWYDLTPTLCASPSTLRQC